MRPLWHWVKSKNPKHLAVKREAEEDWGREREMALKKGVRQPASASRSTRRSGRIPISELLLLD